MTSFETIAQSVVDRIFLQYGSDVTVHPASGPPIPARAIRKGPDRVDAFDRAQVLSTSTMFELRVSEVPVLAKDDRITVGAETFTIVGEPRREDSCRLVWVVEAVLS